MDSKLNIKCKMTGNEYNIVKSRIVGVEYMKCNNSSGDGTIHIKIASLPASLAVFTDSGTIDEIASIAEKNKQNMK